jgi:hypothetical protein
MVVLIQLQLIIVKNICGIILQKKLDEYGKEIKNDILILGGIHGYVYVDLATVAKIEISDKDKGPLVLVNSQVNDDEIDKKWRDNYGN